MEFGLSQTQQQVRDQVQAYVTDEIIGENGDWGGGNSFPDEIYQDFADMGILGMTVSEEIGGADFDPVTTGVVFEQLGRGDVALTMLMMVQNIANAVLYEHGNSYHRKIAEQNVEGEVILSWGLTEPDHGADASSIEIEVEPDDDGYVLNGEKTAITGATFGDYIIVYGRETVDDEIRAFLVPYDAEGVSVQKYEGLGCSVSGWGQVFFDDVTVGERARVSEQNGFKLAMEQFDPSRGWIPLYCLGAAQQSLDETVEYLMEREAFGKAVAEFQGPQFEVAEMQSRVDATRLKAYEALWRAKEGKPFTKDASMAKYMGTELAASVIHDCMILHGHYGYSADFGLGKRMQDVIGLEIGEGPHQIQKLVIGREIFGREYLPY